MHHLPPFAWQLGLGLASIDLRLSTRDLAPTDLESDPAPSSVACWHHAARVLNGADILRSQLPPSLAELGRLGGELAVVRKTSHTGRSIDCSKSLRLISSAARRDAVGDDNHHWSGAFDLSQEEDADGIARRRERQFRNHHGYMRRREPCGDIGSHMRGQVDHVDSKALRISSEVEEGGAIGHQRLVDRASADSTDSRSLARTIARSMTAVDARRILDRVGEAAARSRSAPERRSRSECRDRAAQLNGARVHPAAMPASGEWSGTDAAANADNGGHDGGLSALGLTRGPEMICWACAKLSRS